MPLTAIIENIFTNQPYLSFFLIINLKDTGFIANVSSKARKMNNILFENILKEYYLRYCYQKVSRPEKIRAFFTGC
jgi:hypothetical protein